MVKNDECELCTLPRVAGEDFARADSAAVAYFARICDEGGDDLGALLARNLRSELFELFEAERERHEAKYVLCAAQFADGADFWFEAKIVDLKMGQL